jgi:hypothetical protein
MFQVAGTLTESSAMEITRRRGFWRSMCTPIAVGRTLFTCEAFQNQPES